MIENIKFVESTVTLAPDFERWELKLSGFVEINGKLLRCDRTLDGGGYYYIPKEQLGKKFPKTIPIERMYMPIFNKDDIPKWKEEAKVEIENELLIKIITESIHFYLEENGTHELTSEDILKIANSISEKLMP